MLLSHHRHHHPAVIPDILQHLESMREKAEFSDVIFWNMVHLIDIFVT